MPKKLSYLVFCFSSYWRRHIGAADDDDDDGQAKRKFKLFNRLAQRIILNGFIVRRWRHDGATNQRWAKVSSILDFSKTQIKKMQITLKYNTLGNTNFTLNS